MERQALEALSSRELERLIATAAEVLAARASAHEAGAVGAGSSSAAPAGAAAPAQSTGGLFTFGSALSSATGAASSGGGLFTFGASSSSGTSGRSPSNGPSNPFSVAQAKSLFGSGGGLFSELGTEPGADGAKASIFAPPGRVAASDAVDGAAAKAADGGKEGGEAGEDEGGEEDLVPHEEVTQIQGWTPSITLEVCGPVANGEEDEEEIYSQRSKLYRFRDGEWKERGLGEARLLKNKTSGRVRFLLRQEKTGKVAANFFVIDHQPYCDLRPNAESEKIWVWCAQDFSDGEANVEEFALKFNNAELAGKFKKAFEDAKQNCKTAEGLEAPKPKDSEDKAPSK